MENKPLEKRLLTVLETAAYLGISPRTIYNGIGQRAKKPFPIRPVRIGSSIRFDRKDIDEYIESKKK